MKTNTIHLGLKTSSTALFIAAASLCGPTSAADRPLSPQARFQQERAACVSGLSHQDRETCLYEARSAYGAASRGALNNGDGDLEVNARKRCEALPVADRVACLARMDGAGVTLGSVEEGGIYRELVVREVVLTAPPVDDKSPDEPE